MKKAVLIVSHGSRKAETKLEIEELSAKLRHQLPNMLIFYAFLELEAPSIPDGIRECITAGAQEVIVTLNFLNAGRHVNHDIPEIIEGVQKEFPNVDIRITSPVGQEDGIVDVFARLVKRES